LIACLIARLSDYEKHDTQKTAQIKRKNGGIPQKGEKREKKIKNLLLK
jgi:hypothetical protein